LDLGLGADYLVTPAIALGGLFEYDYGLSGSRDFKVDGESDGKVALKSYSAMGFGLAFKYGFTPAIQLGADFASLSGSFQEEEVDGFQADAVNFTGTRFRVVGIYMF
jgi:hypothetical protein